MMKKLAKCIRIVTTAPVLAAILLLLLHYFTADTFSELRHFLLALFYLSVFPALAYPTAWIFPRIRKKGRNGERNLAIVFSMVGYALGFLHFLRIGTEMEQVVFGTYLLSGLLIAAGTLLHFKASGHASGVSGPVAMLCYCVNPLFVLGDSLLLFVYWSSLRLKRHSLAQLIAGTLTPIAAMLLCLRWL